MRAGASEAASGDGHGVSPDPIWIGGEGETREWVGSVRVSGWSGGLWGVGVGRLG